MNVAAEVLTRLGRIEGRIEGVEGKLIEIGKLNERVNRLENWLAWLRGGWAALAAGYFYLSRLFGRW